MSDTNVAQEYELVLNPILPQEYKRSVDRSLGAYVIYPGLADQATEQVDQFNQLVFRLRDKNQLNDLAHSYWLIKAHLVKAGVGGGNYAAGDNVTLGSGWSLFDSVKLYIDTEAVSENNQYFGVKQRMKSLYCKRRVEMTGDECFDYPDSGVGGGAVTDPYTVNVAQGPPVVVAVTPNELYNDFFTKKFELTNASGEFQILLPMSDLLEYFKENIQCSIGHRIEFSRNTSTGRGHVFHDADAADGVVVIDKMLWHIPRVKESSSSAEKVNTWLAGNPSLKLWDEFQLCTYNSLGTGDQTFRITGKTGKMKYILLTFLDNTQVNYYSQQSNGLIFNAPRRCSIGNVCAMIGGKQYPQERYLTTSNWNLPDGTRWLYDEYLRCCENYNGGLFGDVMISYQEFVDHYNIFTIPCYADDASAYVAGSAMEVNISCTIGAMPGGVNNVTPVAIVITERGATDHTSGGNTITLDKVAALQ